MKKSESELNLEAALRMSSEGEGEGECSGGSLGIKGTNVSDKAAGEFLPEKSSFDHELDVGALVDELGFKDNFSSYYGQPSNLAWCPPALRGSIGPASTGGSGLTYGCKTSGELSDDEKDDMEMEAGQCEQILDSSKLKARRRESARQTRRRKQMHLDELASQVDQLRGENFSLFKQLTEISQRCKDAANNNPVQKSDVEALRATGFKGNFSSYYRQPSNLAWCPPALRGSSPASTGGSRLTYGCKNSVELSDDEENDMEMEAGQCEQSLDSNELKRLRRMLSNRESARRSRRRRQTHLNELESQVDQLRGENFLLFKQLTEISQRCKDAANNNRVLKSDVEALRATVKMAQDLFGKRPLANIINQRLLQQTSFNPPLTSWDMCRQFDLPQVLDNGCYEDASLLIEALNIEAERSGSDIKLKADDNFRTQRTTNSELLQNRVYGAADTWPWDATTMTKPC